MNASCLKLLLLIALINAIFAIELHYPAIALCSAETLKDLPSFVCQFRSSQVDELSTCDLQAIGVNFTMANASGTLLRCWVYNYNFALTASDAGSVLVLSAAPPDWVDSVALLRYDPFCAGGGVLALGRYTDLITVRLQSAEIRLLGSYEGRYTRTVHAYLPAPGAAQELLLLFDTAYFEHAARIDWASLLEPGTVLIIVCALLAIWYGAYRAHAFHQTLRGSAAYETSNQITWRTALLLPLGGSLMLVLLFFFLDKMYILLLIFMGLAAFTSVSFVLWPYIDALVLVVLPRLPREIRTTEWLGALPTTTFFVLPAALLFIALWITTRHWFISDVLALAIGVTAMSYLRLPSLRISALILGLFLLYDVFWVFLSPIFFGGKSVMVEVATGFSGLPMIVLIPRFGAPNGRDFSLLGMGDVILPGLFLSFLYWFDAERGTKPRKGYFGTALAGYAVGFLLTWNSLLITRMGQPALLFLVPCTLLPTIVRAMVRGEFAQIWRGTPVPRLKRMKEGEGRGELELEAPPERGDVALQEEDMPLKRNISIEPTAEED